MLRCALYCWLPWWLSLSIPRPPNLECFSALTSGWTYPSPFPTQIILSIHEASAPLYPFKSFPGWGCRAQLTGQPYLPWCLLAPTTSSKQMGNGWPKPALCSPPHGKRGISWHTHTTPLQTLAKLTFPTRQLHSISTLPCQNDYTSGVAYE